MIKLNVFIPLKDMAHDAIFTNARSLPIVELYLPTEVVVRKAEFVVPRTARVYTTNLYFHGGEVLDYAALRSKVGPEIFRGILHYPEVFLWEVWEDTGSDGHTYFSLVGYVYRTNTEYPLPKDHCYDSGTYVDVMYPMEKRNA